jgi:ABC-type Fe3+/spermidine/putrescine transport system ATPase subunit
MGASNILSGRIVETVGNASLVELSIGRVTVQAAGLTVGDRVNLAIRPEKIKLSATGPEGIPARVDNVVYTGASMQVHLTIGGVRLVAHVPNDDSQVAGFAVGDAVRCSWLPASLVRLEA